MQSLHAYWSYSTTRRGYQRSLYSEITTHVNKLAKD